jgi:uncharacterized delta-60 repeat protein
VGFTLRYFTQRSNSGQIDSVRRQRRWKQLAVWYNGTMISPWAALCRASPCLFKLPLRLACTLTLSVFAISSNLRAASPAGSGRVDLSFDCGRGPVTVAPGSGGKLLVQTDGRVIVGGHFNAVGLNFVAPIIRFNVDGSLDESFNAVALTSGQFSPTGSTDMNPLALDAYGRVLVSGQLVDLAGTTRYFIRLNADGSLDSTFNPRIESSSAPGTVDQAAVLSDGKIVIAGAFNSVNGTPRNGLARLNADGSLDPRFNAAASGKFEIQSSGKLIVAAADTLRRLNTDGSMDDSFHAQITTPDGAANRVVSILVQADDKILYSTQYGFLDRTIIGRLEADGADDLDFKSGNYANAFLLAIQRDDAILIATLDSSEPGRLNSDGTPDWSFNRGAIGYSVVQQSDGNLMTAGPLYDPPYGVRRLFLDGNIDISFRPDVGLTVIEHVAARLAALLPNGGYVAAGEFDVFDRLPRRGIATLKHDGSPDPVFDPADLFSYQLDGSAVSAMAVQVDGKIVVAFGKRLVRMNQDGSLDSTFNQQETQPIKSINIQPDRKILVARSELIRLSPDGTDDASFHADQPGRVVALQPDGKILLQDEVRGLTRLNPDGSQDAGFTAASVNVFNLPYAVAFQPDGKLLLSRFDISRSRDVFVRLNNDGSSDDTFDPDVNSVSLIAVDQTGIYAAGQIEPRGAAKQIGICRFNFDGTRDPNFNVELDEEATLAQLLVEPDGQLLIAGRFSRVNGVERHGLARIIGTAPQKLANISTRVLVGIGDLVAIGGFIVTGSSPKTVIIRALGPSLQTSGVTTETLADPELEVYNSSARVLARNDDWRATQEAEIIASGLPPTADTESAVVLTLQPGSYTAVIRGKGGSTGTAVAEIYDLDPGADSALANISTRGTVSGEGDMLIAGFILRGAEPRTVVVRAVGPSLASFGVQGPVQNPSIALFDQSGSVIAANNDWADTQRTELEAYGLGMASAQEAALVVRLPPGQYTAIVRSGDNDTGSALVEVYNIP